MEGGVVTPMSAPRCVAPEPLAVSRDHAAHMLGVSLSHFQRHVQRELPCVYLGARRVYPVSDLRRWLAERTEPPPTLR